MDNKKINTDRLILVAIGIIIVITLGYGALLLYLTWPINKYSIVNAGVFGDSFGLLTSIFSGLAFGGLIITILMQREEITSQREEIQKQNETMSHQKFENTFFQTLTLHNEILRGIDVRGIERGSFVDYKGRDVFKHFYDQLINNEPRRNQLKSDNLKTVNDAYLEYFARIEHEIGHYFRSLYNVIKFIDRSDIKDKKFYTNLVRTQLSSHELFFLFYNCLSDKGREKFKPLIEKYGLLKTLPNSLIVNLNSHKAFYDEKAFL